MGGALRAVRSGHKHKLGFEGGQMRLLRRIQNGFNNERTSRCLIWFQWDAWIADDGTEITPELLRTAGLIQLSGANSEAPIKILGNGELTRKLVVQAHAFSQSAEQKITAAGGTVKLID